MDIVYKKGATNHADALSRRPDLKEAFVRLRLINDRDLDLDEAAEEAFHFEISAALVDANPLLEDI